MNWWRFKECQKEKLKGWTNSNGLEEKLIKLAEVEPFKSKGYETYNKGGEKPSSIDATAALSYYPYNGSSVYQCGTCQCIILIYLETAGHGARYQARWIPSYIRLES